MEERLILNQQSPSSSHLSQLNLNTLHQEDPTILHNILKVKIKIMLAFQLMVGIEMATAKDPEIEIVEMIMVARALVEEMTITVKEEILMKEIDNLVRETLDMKWMNIEMMKEITEETGIETEDASVVLNVVDVTLDQTLQTQAIRAHHIEEAERIEEVVEEKKKEGEVLTMGLITTARAKHQQPQLLKQTRPLKRNQMTN